MYTYGNQQKENTFIEPSQTAKGKVSELRNQFFKYAQNDNSESLSPRIFDGTNLENGYAVRQQVKPEKRSYSAYRLEKTMDKSDVGKSQAPSEITMKRETRMRREFDVKISNINQISSKIEELLKYVKQVGKDQRISNQPCKNENDSLEVMRTREMKRIKENLQRKEKVSPFKDNPQKLDTSVKFTRPANAEQTTNSYCKYQYEEQYCDRITIQQLQKRTQQTKRRQLASNMDVKKFQLTDKQQAYHQQTLRYQPKALYSNMKLEQLNIEDYLPSGYSNNGYLDKSARVMKTPDRAEKMGRNTGSIKVSPIRRFHQRSQTETQKVQCNRPEFPVEDQISKIKNRIQQSQKQRKKLQQKYAHYSQSDFKQVQKQPGKLYQFDRSSRLHVQKQGVDLLNREKTPRTSEFKIKVFPCQQQRADRKKQSVVLAEVLGKQVLLDQKLREAREKLSRILSEQKWFILNQQLGNLGLKHLKIQELQQQLAISTEEHNPFHNTDLSESSINCIAQIAQLYVDSYRHWTERVLGCVSAKALEQQNFSVKDLDLQKKGCLSIEDLVCFVNLCSGNFFRNRDVLPLYKRFIKLQLSSKTGNRNGVEYSVFLERLCQH